MDVMTGFFPSQDGMILIIRLCLGLFFVLARFRYFYDPSRPDNRWFNKARHEPPALEDVHLPFSEVVGTIRSDHRDQRRARGVVWVPHCPVRVWVVCGHSGCDHMHSQAEGA